MTKKNLIAKIIKLLEEQTNDVLLLIYEILLRM